LAAAGHLRGHADTRVQLIRCEVFNNSASFGPNVLVQGSISVCSFATALTGLAGKVSSCLPPAGSSDSNTPVVAIAGWTFAPHATVDRGLLDYPISAPYSSASCLDDCTQRAACEFSVAAQLDRHCPSRRNNTPAVCLLAANRAASAFSTMPTGQLGPPPSNTSRWLEEVAHGVEPLTTCATDVFLFSRLGRGTLMPPPPSPPAYAPASPPASPPVWSIVATVWLLAATLAALLAGLLLAACKRWRNIGGRRGLPALTSDLLINGGDGNQMLDISRTPDSHERTRREADSRMRNTWTSSLRDRSNSCER
jgi:hypothetical protein